MQEDIKKAELTSILNQNIGFENPELWIDYARKSNFKLVKAKQLKACPDCSSKNTKKVGQYVYYSSLATLFLCRDCSLIYSNLRIDLKVIMQHFESAYKDEQYFKEKRRNIFTQISNLASSKTPQNGSILDYGGAKGVQLDIIKEQREDIDFTLSDISKQACDFASKEYGFKTITGGIQDVESELKKNKQKKYDTIIFSDVIYYEDSITKIWQVLPQIIKPEGHVLIRVPNKIFLIKLFRFVNKTFQSINFLNKKKPLETRVKYFNPEHLYILTNKYLKNRLESAGFKEVEFLPSELLGSNNIAINLYYKLSLLIYKLSFKKIIITPSLLVLAKKKE